MSAVGPGGPAPADAANHVPIRHRRLRDAAARRGVPLATILVTVAVVVLTSTPNQPQNRNQPRECDRWGR